MTAGARRRGLRRAASDSCVSSTRHLHPEKAPSSPKKLDGDRLHRTKHIASHTALGAVVGGLTLGPIGIAIGAGKGLGAGLVSTEPRLRDPAVKFVRQYEPMAVKTMRYRVADGMASAQHRLYESFTFACASVLGSGTKGAEPSAQPTACGVRHTRSEPPSSRSKLE